MGHVILRAAQSSPPRSLTLIAYNHGNTKESPPYPCLHCLAGM